MLTRFDFPAEHWLHIRTMNPVESPFAMVRLRQRVTKGAVTRTNATAEQRWRRVNGAHLLPWCGLG